MAQAKGKSTDGIVMTRVKRKAKKSRNPNRQPAMVTIEPTGAAKTNTEGAEMILDLARDLQKNLDTFTVGFGGNEEQEQAGIYVEDFGAEDGVAVKRSKTRSGSPIFRFHMGDLFVDYPKLRQVGRVQCKMERRVDQEGAPFILIPMHLAEAKRAKTRGAAAAGD